MRNPAHAAQSLKRRNRIPHRLAYSLWHEHYRRLLDHADDSPLWFVDYADLLDPQRCQQELRLAFRFMRIEASSAKLVELSNAHVKPGTGHAQKIEAISAGQSHVPRTRSKLCSTQ